MVALLLGGIASAQTATPAPSLKVCIVHRVLKTARRGTCPKHSSSVQLATGSAPITFTTPGATLYTVPAGVSQLELDVVGGGGGGGASDLGGGGGGGGSGGVGMFFIPVRSGDVCSLTVGVGGPGATLPPGPGAVGQASTVSCDGQTPTATGGTGGQSASGTPGTGGAGGTPSGIGGGSGGANCPGGAGGTGGGAGYGAGGAGAPATNCAIFSPGQNGSNGEIVITPLA